MEESYSQFSGRVLETYFQNKAMESGKYTEVGNWWDRSGENEINLVAVNEQSHTGFIAEVKRNPRKISLPILAKRWKHCPRTLLGNINSRWAVCRSTICRPTDNLVSFCAVSPREQLFPGADGVLESDWGVHWANVRQSSGSYLMIQPI